MSNPILGSIRDSNKSAIMTKKLKASDLYATKLNVGGPVVIAGPIQLGPNSGFVSDVSITGDVAVDGTITSTNLVTGELTVTSYITTDLAVTESVASTVTANESIFSGNLVNLSFVYTAAGVVAAGAFSTIATIATKIPDRNVGVTYTVSTSDDSKSILVQVTDAGDIQVYPLTNALADTDAFGIHLTYLIKAEAA
jgi:hypothetical protein